MIKQVVFGAGLLALLAGCVEDTASQSQVAAAPTGGSTAAIATTAGFGAALNGIRASNGIGAVTRNAKLDRAAQNHASDMAQRAYFSHVSPDGRSVGNRAKAVGYNYCTIAENIAWGQNSEAEALQVWMDSPGHRANNLNRSVTEYGLARAGAYWVLVLGKPC